MRPCIAAFEILYAKLDFIRIRKSRVEELISAPYTLLRIVAGFFRQTLGQSLCLLCYEL